MTSQLLRTADDLIDAGFATSAQRATLNKVAERYAVAITPEIARLVDPNDPNDPIARQFVPSADELAVTAEELADPIGDDAHSPIKGIVHRYRDRVLLKAVHVCPVYCRFCFRREMVGPGKRSALTAKELEAALDYVRAHGEIWEVILTGGDPLILSARRLRAVVRDLAAIDHVKVLRVHTRVPTAAPERITRDLVRALKVAGKATYVVVHVNHPRELTAEARAACARLVDAGIPVLSQTVLLRGVNDDAVTMTALMRALVECRIKPYYLHHGDLAPGTGHLRTTIEDGQGLMRELRGDVSGLCQPTYVLDIPGGAGKVPAGPSYVSPRGAGHEIEDRHGRLHNYPPT